MEETEQKEQENKIKDYLKKYLKKGYSRESLRKTLIDFGYSKKIVDKCLNSDQTTRRSYFSWVKNIRVWEHWSWLVAAGAIILLILVTFFILDLPVNCDFDKQCFIDNAIQGKTVTVKEDIAGSTLQYTNKDGQITKEFVAFSKDEPEEVVSLLKGKTMTCSYDVFDETLVDGIFGGVDNCEGDLLDVLYEMAVIS